MRLLEHPGHRVAAVVTQPDRPKGRRRKPSPCALKAAAAGTGVPILTPVNVNTAASEAALRELAPEAVFVASYGQILKPNILALPPRGCVNLHASLLPAYRGAAPIQWAIAKGECETGVTTFCMDKGMDTGDLLLQQRVPIRSDDTAASLEARLSEVGAGLLVDTADALQAGTVAPRAQDHERATYARKLSKTDGRIDWTAEAHTIECRVRAFTPWPGCYFERAGRRVRTVRVWKARVEDGTGEPGTVLDLRGDGPLVATGLRALRLLCLQPEGGKPMDGAAYLNGHPMEAGQRIGPQEGGSAS